jgi:protein tyrosine/serine phosphatase
MINKVSEGIYRGPRLDDLSPLSNLGIDTILNLENNMNAVLSEKLMALAFDIKVLSLPMSEIFRPSKEQLKFAIGLIKYHKPIYVHCLHGCDRTGMVIAKYRIEVEGWSIKDAFGEAVRMGHKWWFPPYWFWRKCLT